jgi:hypothetical protein
VSPGTRFLLRGAAAATQTKVPKFASRKNPRFSVDQYARQSP